MHLQHKHCGANDVKEQANPQPVTPASVNGLGKTAEDNTSDWVLATHTGD